MQLRCDLLCTADMHVGLHQHTWDAERTAVDEMMNGEFVECYQWVFGVLGDGGSSDDVWGAGYLGHV
jgi:hypothetical protein